MFMGMVSILATWLLVLLAFCGIGLSIQRLFGLKNQKAEQVLASFWIGWAFVLMILQLWHLVAPVDLRAAVCVILLGAAGLLWNGSRLSLLFRNRGAARSVFIMTFCLFALWLANRAMRCIQPYDAGLYHLNVIRWIASYSIIPGLGNLHGRLAFNNSYFLFLALLDVGPWRSMSYHLANGLLLLVLCLQIGLSVLKMVVNRHNIQAYDLFQILLIPPVIHKCFSQVSSTSPDLPVFILGIVISVQLCKLLFSSDSYHEITFETFYIIILSAIGITIKLSFSPIGCVSSLIALGKYIVYRLRWKIQVKSLHFNKLIWMLVAPALILLPWMLRGVMLSGYIAYPGTFGSFNVEWKVPYEKVNSMNKIIKSWARLPVVHPDKVLANWNWVLPWTTRVIERRETQFNILFPLILGIIGVIFTFCRQKSRDTDFFLYTLFLLPAASALIFWFYMAPALSFAGAAFWCLGAGALLTSFKSRHLDNNPKVIVFVFILMVIFTTAEHLKYEKFIDPGPLHGFYPLPTVEMHPFVTNSGLTLYVPNEGDQCWDAPLPCTPDTNPNLQLRKVGKIQSGFMISSKK